VHKDGEVIEYWNPIIRDLRGAMWRLFGWYVWDQGDGLPGDWAGRLAPSHEFIFHFNRNGLKPNKTKQAISAKRNPSGGGLRKSSGEITERTGADHQSKRYRIALLGFIVKCHVLTQRPSIRHDFRLVCLKKLLQRFLMKVHLFVIRF
jgi:hypothetical protein